jgi:outer membrane protein assembly factor BamE (lipoprotein component of BamABCDE complex)
MKTLLVVLTAVWLIVAGCSGLPSGAGSKTMSLEMGMDKAKVQEVMGKPGKTEAYQAGGAVLEAWFYSSCAFSGCSDLGYIALDFKDGKLVGWGDRF